MRFMFTALAVLALTGCQKGDGESKSEVVTNEETGEKVRSMVIQLHDVTIDGMQFEGVAMTVQGLNDAGEVVAFADGKTEADVTMSHIAVRITRDDNHYKDLWRYSLLNFQLPMNATQFKLDYSKIPHRVCTPEPVTAKVSDVPDVTGTTNSGNRFTISAQCSYDYTLAGTATGVDGEMEITINDTIKQTITGTGDEVQFTAKVDSLVLDTTRQLTTEELTDFSTKVPFEGELYPEGDYQVGRAVVKVTKAPTGKVCTVTNGSKDLEYRKVRHSPDKEDPSGEGYNVGGQLFLREYLEATLDDVRIACVDAAAEYTLSVNVTGLTSGTLKLRNQINLNSLDVTADGTHTFSKKITANDGYDYDVRVMAQPSGLTCTLSNDVATATADVTVTASCAPAVPTYSVGGTITGLMPGDSIVLKMTYGDENTEDTLNFTVTPMDTSFTFDDSLENGTAWSVSVVSVTSIDPMIECAATSASGSIISTDFTGVTITCDVP